MGSSIVSHFEGAMHDHPSMHPNFGLEDCVIRTYGMSGRWVKDIDRDLWFVGKFRPEVVILYAGGNDLASFKHDGRIEIVGKRMVDTAVKLHEQYGVRYVLVSGLLPRFPPYSWLQYPPDYNRKRLACNQYVQAVLEEETDYARLWSYEESLWPRGLFGEDGVHLMSTGNKVWYKELRGCIVKALRGEAFQ